MASFYVECWQFTKCVVPQRLIRTDVDITLEVFEKHVKPRLTNHGSCLAVKAKSSDSGKPEGV